ncbi:trypsin-4, partial [Aedes aegypti]
HHTSQFRIINGASASITQFPYLVSVQRKTFYSRYHICGGTFISLQWIMTAAHCLVAETTDGLVIRAESSFHDRGGVLLRVDVIIVHDQYANTDDDYDFGLIRLRRPFRRAQVVGLRNGPKRFPPGFLCDVMGWGKTNYSKVSYRLRRVSLPIVKQSICQAAYRGRRYNVTRRMLCAGFTEGGQDACKGDSGGPLVCNKTLTGIISWAIGCASRNFYGVYSDITQVRAWIRNKTGV